MLDLEVASIWLRAVAFAADMALIAAVYTATGLVVLGLSLSFDFGGWFFAAYLAFIFLFRILYFVILESRGRGQTPGKRLMGVRVVDSHGRPLTASATFLRNVSRDVEMFLPLTVLVAPDLLLPNAPTWFAIFPLLWVVLLGVFPLLSPLGLRPGDVIAGTLVVLQPRLSYLQDMAEGNKHAVQLSAEQLDMYGIKELQLLEHILRDHPSAQTTRELADRIGRKLGVASTIWARDPEKFVRSVYAQLRTRHEQRILFGDRQAEKREGRLGGDDE